MVATHFPELASLSSRLGRAGSYRLVADRDQMGIIFTYQVQVSWCLLHPQRDSCVSPLPSPQPGLASHSFGIEVAQSAGIPLEVIQRAKVGMAWNNGTSLVLLTDKFILCL